jgi:hypothetical protein
MRLALACGRVDVDRLAAELTSAELSEWQAFDRIEPFGGERGDLQAAGVAWMVYKTAHPTGKLRVADFMPTFGPPADDAPAAEKKRPPAELARDRIRAGFAVLAAMFKAPDAAAVVPPPPPPPAW